MIVPCFESVILVVVVLLQNSNNNNNNNNNNSNNNNSYSIVQDDKWLLRISCTNTVICIPLKVFTALTFLVV